MQVLDARPWAGHAGNARLVRHCRLLGILVAWLTVVASARADEAFNQRGYYLTFMRMPIMGLVEWKQAIDCFADDDANVMILWIAGGFRSKKYPITWRYNEEHENVRANFLPDLIDFAHSKRIQILLGFTPFGYDGVNQLPIEHPELKAQKQDGRPVEAFGIHAWGWNLCASQREAQTFMREYVREMYFEFYPKADGLFIESSDYGVCHCPRCGPNYYEREFEFVRKISEDVWQSRSNATIVVYPHYFTRNKVAGSEVPGARLPFDPRWTLFFTPHSAHFDAELIRQAKHTIFWGDSPILGTPPGVQAHARTARANGMTGFVPSLEAFSFVPYRAEGGEPYVVGRRRSPFGLDATQEGRMPYTSLMARIQRLAVREFSHHPDLPIETFKQRLSKEVFGNNFSAAAVDDLLALQESWVFESDWSWPSPLLDPDFFQARAQRLNWPQAKLDNYAQRLQRFGDISARYRDSSNDGERELSQLAARVVERWRGREGILRRTREN